MGCAHKSALSWPCLGYPNGYEALQYQSFVVGSWQVLQNKPIRKFKLILVLFFFYFFVRWIKKISTDCSIFVNLVFSTIGLNKWQLLHQTVTSPAAPLQCLTDHCGFRLGALKLTVKRAGLSVLSPATKWRGHRIITYPHPWSRLG